MRWAVLAMTLMTACGGAEPVGNADPDAIELCASACGGTVCILSFDSCAAGHFEVPAGCDEPVTRSLNPQVTPTCDVLADGM